MSAFVGSKDAAARKSEQILMELLRDEPNKHCADCGQKGTRWASWNLGVFLCIRCGGLHRKLGTHISKVKSVNLDKWTDEQVQNMVQNGNLRVNQIYNPHPERFPFPSYSGDMENYIRDKYERKLFMSPDSRRPSNGSGSATNSRPVGAGPPVDEPRYPIQMRSLREMGFNDTPANQAALLATKGNLQEAIECLLSDSRKGTAASANGNNALPPPAEEGKKKTKMIDELVDIFKGTSVSPPPSASGKKSQVSGSILDLDEIPMDEQNRSPDEEFEEFTSAAVTTTEEEPARTDHRSSSKPPEVSSDQEEEIREKVIESKKSLPKQKTALSMNNPWASSNADGAGVMDSPFDDIDPFRGFSQ